MRPLKLTLQKQHLRGKLQTFGHYEIIIITAQLCLTLSMADHNSPCTSVTRRPALAVPLNTKKAVVLRRLLCEEVDKCYRCYHGTDAELWRHVRPDRQFDPPVGHHVLPLRQSEQVGTSTEVEERSKSSPRYRDCVTKHGLVLNIILEMYLRYIFLKLKLWLLFVVFTFSTLCYEKTFCCIYYYFINM